MLPMGYSWKYIYKQGGWEYTFLKKPPGIFRFVTLTLEIPKKKSFYPWKFCKIVWQKTRLMAMEIHMIFSWTHLEIPILF